MRTEEVIRLIKESVKKTPVTVYVSGNLEGISWESSASWEARTSG